MAPENESTPGKRRFLLETVDNHDSFSSPKDRVSLAINGLVYNPLNEPLTKWGPILQVVAFLTTWASQHTRPMRHAPCDRHACGTPVLWTAQQRHTEGEVNRRGSSPAAGCWTFYRFFLVKTSIFLRCCWQSDGDGDWVNKFVFIFFGKISCFCLVKVSNSIPSRKKSLFFFKLDKFLRDLSGEGRAWDGR